MIDPERENVDFPTIMAKLLGTQYDSDLVSELIREKSPQELNGIAKKLELVLSVTQSSQEREHFQGVWVREFKKRHK